MNDIKNRLLKRFRAREYRHAYVESFLNSLISGQIRALREREKMSQQQLAETIGTTQPGVSRFESPDYSSWRIETLRKIARAFDMALSIKFVGFGDIIEDIDGFDADRLLRPSFADDPVFHGGVSQRGEDPRANVVDFPRRSILVADPPARSEGEAQRG